MPPRSAGHEDNPETDDERDAAHARALVGATLIAEGLRELEFIRKALTTAK